MSIRFPETEEVKLAASPLHEVVCQVRFPPILRIVSEQPIDFQERIRTQFPIMKVEHGIQVQIPSAGSNSAAAADVNPKLFRFSSMDDQHTVSLTSDFYAISTHSYTNWQGFADMLALIYETAGDLYAPAFATRIGLRYINHLTLTNSGHQSRAELFNMLRPEATALFRGDVWQDAENGICLLTFRDSREQLNLRIVNEGSKDDPRLVLDFDYFETGQIMLNDLVERCYRFHNVIYRAFRWCLLSDALAAFQPQREAEV